MAVVPAVPRPQPVAVGVGRLDVRDIDVVSRRLFDDQGLPWQVGSYKVGVGGGGTIGAFLSDDNMEVMDIGIPILSMHSPFELGSKADVYVLYRGIKAFFEGFE